MAPPLNLEIDDPATGSRSQPTRTLMTALMVVQVALQGILLWRLLNLERILTRSPSNTLLTNDAIASSEFRFVGDVETGQGVPLGNPGAPVVVVEFSDFTCPYCKAFAPALRSLVEENPDKVVLYYRNFIHVEDAVALQAAEAGVCSESNGHFWAMHDQLFSLAPGLTTNTILGAAATLGLDGGALTKCMNSETTLGIIRADLDYALKLGVNGTPTTVVGGYMVVGTTSQAALQSVVNRLTGGG